MADKIRLVTENDLNTLEELFKQKKTKAEIRWFLQSPDDIEKLNGFVAENADKKIVGMIGFEVGTYFFGDKEVTGSTFMSWKIADNHKGFAGIMMINKALSMGDFGMAIKGSELAQKMYPKFNLAYIGSSYMYYKVFNPIKYFLSLKGRPLIKKAGHTAIIIRSFFNNYKSRAKNLTIKSIEKSDITRDIPYLHKEYCEKKITKNYLHWLMSCPIRDSYAFEINKGELFLGYAVCYIEKDYYLKPRGRIVYMPNMGGNQSDWLELITFLMSFLKEKKCNGMTVLGLDDSLRTALGKFGFVNYKTKHKPIFIRDSKKVLEGLTVNNWFMQYTEGDKTYRAM